MSESGEAASAGERRLWILGNRLGLALCFVVACKARPTEEPVAMPTVPAAKSELTGPFKNGDNIGVAAPTGASHADWIKPAKPVPFSRPTRERNSQEEVLYGTWAAKVGDYASRSVYMADRTVYALDSSKDLVANAATAIANDNRLASACIWLELRADFTGFRRECAVVNGEASALDETDFATGKKKDLGTALEWFIDDKDANKIKIHFAADMVVPAMRDGRLRMLVFRTWWLQLGKQTAEANTFEVTESFPEHDYTLPTKYAYFIGSQRFLDQK